jgi:hypothetical protein
MGLNLKTCLATGTLRSSCNLSSLQVQARCFAFEIVLRQQSCSHQVGWGHWPLCLSCPKIPLTSQLVLCRSFSLSMSLSWPSPLIYCGQVSQDTLNCNCFLFSRSPQPHPRISVSNRRSSFKMEPSTAL